MQAPMGEALQRRLRLQTRTMRKEQERDARHREVGQVVRAFSGNRQERCNGRGKQQRQDEIVRTETGESFHSADISFGSNVPSGAISSDSRVHMLKTWARSAGASAAALRSCRYCSNSSCSRTAASQATDVWCAT